MSQRTFNTGVLKSTWEQAKAAIEAELEEDDMQDRTRNEVTTELYEYEALKGRVLPLRLVELLPGTRQEDITCRMYETSLDECTGSYEALSYVWGSDSEKTPIQINGRTLEIGLNLRLALFNLRELDKPRTLWVDAICIRQDCISERNQQVAVMDEIYRRARRTVVWLRDEVKGETSAAISMLEALAKDAISRSQERSSHGDGNGEVENIVHLNNLPESMIEKAGVTDPMFDRYQNDATAIHLLRSQWWYRAWTLQEILLASKAITVIGRYSIDWDHLRIGVNHGLGLGIWAPISMGIIRDPNLTPFLSLQWLRLKRQTQDPKEPPGQVLLNLLFQCRFRKASDPHDKIYSLLGLIASTGSNPLVAPIPAHPPLGIKPDYSSPVDIIYTDVARQMILVSNTLDVLGGCGGSPPTPALDPSLTLPSWVPDWSTAQPASPLLHDALGQQRTTHATAHSKALPQFIDTGSSTLLLHAHEIASLTALAPPLGHPIVDPFEVTRDLDKWVDEMDGTALSLRYLADLLGQAWKSLGNMYEACMYIVPLLTTFAKWEAFATEVSPTNPGPGIAGSGPRPEPSPSSPITELVHKVSELGSPDTPDEEPEDQLAVYWQTLCTGTYDAAAAAPGRGRKIASQKLFYSWRASLKPLYQLNRWNADRMLRPLGFVGYVVKTYRMFSEFPRFLEGSYGRRLGRAANGYLCLVPATSEVGDKVILARGGRVPLVVREDRGTGYWRLVGEAYVHGIMDGEAWEEDKCKEFQVR
ncbi:Heterokaryon incompatibility [Penicillium sp. CMV-2018d]|nr:Heterokaryon incompatibility [Penicillium sp. CMV-2018d]